MQSQDNSPATEAQPARGHHPLVARDLVGGTVALGQQEAEHRRELGKLRSKANGKARDSLYASEQEIAQLVLGPGKAKQWTSLVPTLEREGLPVIDPLLGGRFWPAVRAWFEKRHGLRLELVPSGADGQEVWK